MRIGLPSFFRIRTRVWLIVVILIAVMERALLYLFYRPVTFHDTGGYRRAAEAILAGWANLDGTRTPVYPLFLAGIGPDEAVYRAQLALGLMTTLLFFYLGWRLTRKGWFAALAALGYTLNAGQLFFEANLVTESLTTFLLIASLAVFSWLLLPNTERPLWQVILAGLLSGLFFGMTALTRPLFFFLPLWGIFFLLVLWRPAARRARWSAVLAVAFSSLLLIGLWVNFIHERFGIWSLSVLNGYNLIQHTGLFFEYVPEEYAAIRDTYLQYRQAQIAATGVPYNAIWKAIPDLQKVSGLGFIPLSNLLLKISIQLILRHPDLYLRSVFLSWLWFWKAPVYWSSAAVANPALQKILAGLILTERGVMVALNLAFLAGSCSLLWKRARLVLRMPPLLWFAVGVVWLTSIVQALLEHSENQRFSIPVQTVVVLILLWWGLAWIRRKEQNALPAA